MGGSKRKPLNEKELGSLYLLSEAPIVTDRILKAGQWNEKDIADIHNGLNHHAPDMALIGISLSGNLLAEAMKKTGREDLCTLATELKYLSVNTLEEVGRIWIDACRYGIANDQDIHDMVHESADILCMFTSLFMDIAEADDKTESCVRAVAACLMYQSEAHADQARALLENTTSQECQKQAVGARDHIPLPLELQDQNFTDNVVMFSLFSEQNQK